MARGRTIKVGGLVKDIRAGISGTDMREKHGLSMKEFHYVLNRLLKGGDISQVEHDRTVAERGAADEVELTGIVIRRFRRIRTNRGKVFISEADAPANTGRVWDFSEDGVMAVGMKATRGEIKNLVMTFADVKSSRSISFDAECRWTAREEMSGKFMAGFEIVMISDEDLDLLRQRMQAYPVGKKSLWER